MLAWMDLEMTGLDAERHTIIEIATLITDDDLEIVAEGPDLVVATSDEQLALMEDVVRAMHTGSGLLDEVKASSLSLREAGRRTIEFVRAHAEPGRLPLCGNSIGVDRRFLARLLPELDATFHYRSVDVSTLKELAKRWYPSVYGKAPAKAGSHRALGDIKESVVELRYYREHLFRERNGDRPDPEPATADQP